MAALPRIGHLWEDICGYIIRPQRAEYDEAELGPEVFRLSREDKRQFRREDFDLENMRGMKIKCTWFYPNVPNNKCFPMPVVVYLHGNCGCRCDALEILHLLGKGFSLLCYDACGSGMSDGEYVSLGFYERQDLACVIEHINESRRATAIGLWGRSMGAVTSIMYAARDPSIKCLVLDSPFSQLRRLIFDLVKQHAKVMPESMTQMAVKKIRKQIAKLAQFDIDDLDAVKYGSQCSVPTFIFHGKDDDFVGFYHSEMIAEHYKGMCFHHVVDGGHNSFRKNDVMSVAIPHLELYLIAKPNDEKLRKDVADKEKSAEAAKKRIAEANAVIEETARQLQKAMAAASASSVVTTNGLSASVSSATTKASPTQLGSTGGGSSAKAEEVKPPTMVPLSSPAVVDLEPHPGRVGSLQLDNPARGDHEGKQGATTATATEGQTLTASVVSSPANSSKTVSTCHSPSPTRGGGGAATTAASTVGGGDDPLESTQRAVKTTDAEMGAPSNCRAEDEDTDDEEFDRQLELEAEATLRALKEKVGDGK